MALDKLIVVVPFAIVNAIVVVLAYRSGTGTLFGVGGFNGVTGESEGLVPLRVLVAFAETGVAFAYTVWLIGSRRQTWGMQALRVTAIDPSGRPLPRRRLWMRALYRVLYISLWANLLSAAVIIDHHRRPGPSAAASFVPLVLDAAVYLWVLGSGRHQTLIDKAAGSVVVRGDRLGLAAFAGDPSRAPPRAVTPLPSTVPSAPPPPSAPVPPTAPPYPGV